MSKETLIKELKRKSTDELVEIWNDYCDATDEIIGDYDEFDTLYQDMLPVDFLLMMEQRGKDFRVNDDWWYVDDKSHLHSFKKIEDCQIFDMDLLADRIIALDEEDYI